MNPFDAILVATDSSSVANNAVRRAASLAREHNSHLTILHVIDHRGVFRAGNAFSPAFDPTLKTAQAQAELSRLADRLRGTFNVIPELVVTVGKPLDVLASEASSASLVVLGQRAGGSLKDLVLGTPAGRLLDVCARPVLVVRQAAEGPYRRVLTGLDFTPTSDAAALVAAALAPTADLHFTHVFHSKQEDALLQTDVPLAILQSMREREEEGVVARMRRRVASIGFDSRELRFGVVRGRGALSGLYRKHAHGADVVAVGWQRHTSWLEALRESVSRRVLARSQNDVLVVPSLLGVPVAASPSRWPSVDGPATA